jgi:hypothetical protein
VQVLAIAYLVHADLADQLLIQRFVKASFEYEYSTEKGFGELNTKGVALVEPEDRSWPEEVVCLT